MKLINRNFKILTVFFLTSFLFFGCSTNDKKEPNWEPFSFDSFENSLASHNKILIDFYADWCIPCKELDASTFSDSKVIESLKEFKIYKADLTESMSDETEKIRNKFSIKGMPTLIIFGINGKEEKRLSGFINADEFLKILAEVK